MGLFDTLTGKAYSLNMIKGEAKIFLDYASRFNQNSFLYTFFRSMGIASQMFCTYLFEADYNSDQFKKYVKGIDAEKSRKLMKLLSTYFLTCYISEQDDEEIFVKTKKLSFQDLQENVITAANISDSDINNMLGDIVVSFGEGFGKGLVVWAMYFQDNVLNIKPSPEGDLVKSTVASLGNSYDRFKECLTMFSCDLD